MFMHVTYTQTTDCPFLSIHHKQNQQDMAKAVQAILVLAAVFLATVPERSSGEFEQWCIADVQTPDDQLQYAMSWACGGGGANCSMIQENQPCFLPNTVANHASYAFNSYYQKFKSVGASCSFNGAAISTETDPSYGSCHYEYTT